MIWISHIIFVTEINNENHFVARCREPILQPPSLGKITILSIPRLWRFRSSWWLRRTIYRVLQVRKKLSSRVRVMYARADEQEQMERRVYIILL